jgi:hypothetical protein
VTVIEIRPFRNGWQVYEAPGVQLVFLSQEQATHYALCRACFRSGEIHVFGLSGDLERTILFAEADLVGSDSGFLPQVASQSFNLSLAVAIPVGGPDTIDVPAASAEDFFAQAVAVARCGV